MNKKTNSDIDILVVLRSWFHCLIPWKTQEAGGPKIPMKYGRIDISGPEQCPEAGRLPGKLASKWPMYEFVVRICDPFFLSIYGHIKYNRTR